MKLIIGIVILIAIIVVINKQLKKKNVIKYFDNQLPSKEDIEYEAEKNSWLNKVPDCNSNDENKNRELRSLFGFQADIFKSCTDKKLWEEDRWKRD